VFCFPYPARPTKALPLRLCYPTPAIDKRQIQSRILNTGIAKLIDDSEDIA
jgi:hypothetical protein